MFHSGKDHTTDIQKNDLFEMDLSSLIQKNRMPKGGLKILRVQKNNFPLLSPPCSESYYPHYLIIGKIAINAFIIRNFVIIPIMKMDTSKTI